MARTPGTGALFVRADSAGREVWYGKWRVDGRQVKRRLGPRKSKTQPHGMTARQAEVALRDAMTTLTAEELARLASEKRRVGRTIRQVLDAYLADHDDLKKATTVHDYTRVCVNWFTPFFDGKTVDEITRRVVRALRDRMRTTRLRNHGQAEDVKSLAPRSIRNHLTLLSTLLTYAVDRGWASANVAAKVPRPGDQPLPGTPLNQRFIAARDAAGVPPITFHGLRHTFGTTLARDGWPVSDIQALMGHADISTTQIYMHYAPRHDQADRVAAAFAAGDPRVLTTPSAGSAGLSKSD